MRMAQARQSLRFLAEPGPRLLAREKPRRQHLHRHVPPQLLVPGAVHLAHAARAQLLQDRVVGERATDHTCLPSECCGTPFSLAPL
jgi:hypothetical protein